MKNPRTKFSFASKRCLLILMLVGVGSLLGTQNIIAQDKMQLWSLEDCIATAKANNIQVQRQRLQVGAAKSELRSAQVSTLPNLSGWYTHYLNSGKTVNFEDYSYINTQYQDGNVGIQASLPLFQGLQGWYGIQQGKMNLQSAEQQALAMENQISMQIVTAYLQILLSEEIVKISEEKEKVSVDQVKRAEEFFSLGRAPMSEVLTIKSQLAQDHLDLITRKGELDLAYLVMRQLLNLDGDLPFSIERPSNTSNDTFNIPTSNSVYDWARNNQPRILSAQSRVMANEAALKLAQGNTLPSLSLNGLMYSRYSELGRNPLDPEAIYPYKNQLIDNNYMRASLNLTVPIFSRFSNQTQRMISQARMNVLDARLQLEQEHKTMREEIQQATALAQTALARLKASKTAVESAKQANNLIREQFEVGLVTAIDLRVSENQLLLAHANQLQAKYELILRSKILEIFLGKQPRL